MLHIPDTRNNENRAFMLNDPLVESDNEIEEIISQKLPHIVRWGTVYFSILLLVLILISWIIKYPDKVMGTARLNSLNAPKPIVARTDGKLIKMEVSENEQVKKFQTLGYIESIADPHSIKSVSRQIDSIETLIINSKSDEIVHFFPDYGSLKFLNSLGELQSAYEIFIQSFISYKDYLTDGFYLHKKKMLEADIHNISNLHSILIQQKSLLEEDILLSEKTFDINATLLDERVISSLDYRNEKSKLIGKQLSLPQINALIISNAREKIAKEEEVAELDNQISVQKNSFLQALQTIKSEIKAWEYRYELKAPVAGNISFAGFLQENQEMKVGQLMFYVQPEDITYFIEMFVPQYNFGKVKHGQNVLLKFQAYPFEQYGSVIGKVDYIRTTPSDSGYFAKVSLPNALLTNQGKKLLYRNGLLAEANIITEDMRLLERFYYGMVRNLETGR